MKRVFAIILVLLIAIFPAKGALPVVDAAVLAGQQRDYLEQLLQAAQGEEELRHLVQQIVQIDESLKRMGDPALVSKLAGADVLADFLKRGELNRTTVDLLKDLSGSEVLSKEGSSIDRQVRVGDVSVGQRDAEFYQPEAATQRAVLQYEAAREEVLVRRSVLKREIAANIEQTNSATTTSEVMKLNAVASALHAELAALDRELQFAAMEVSHVADVNRLQGEVARKAQLENERAALSVSAKKDAETFRLPSGPVLFNR